MRVPKTKAKLSDRKVKFRVIKEGYAPELFPDQVKACRVVKEGMKLTLGGGEVLLMEPFSRVPTKRDRQFAFLGSVLPSMVMPGETERVPGRSRTAYFYRQEAISWARNARQGLFGIFDGGRDTCVYFAKMYLAEYRKRLAQRAA